MPIVTLAEVKTYCNIADDDSNTAISSLISVVTERLRTLCNNPFTIQELRESVYTRFSRRSGDYVRFDRNEDMYVIPQVSATFDASSKTVIATGENFASAGFAAGQDIFVYGSYRNDGYYEVASVSTSTLTILSAYSFSAAAAGTHEFYDEATGANIYFAVVSWPKDIKPLVASLIQYDIQERGRWHDDEGGSGYGLYDYPNRLLRPLLNYTVPAYGATYR
jgi:hypothetical protein